MSITLRSRRGAIGSTWQGAALRRALEQGISSARTASGRRLARAGRVQWLDVAPGVARSAVLGDDGNSHAARLDVRLLRGDDREVTLDVLRGHPELPTRLAAGDHPEAVEKELAAMDISLLPRSIAEVTHDCSCEDWPGPCAHVAALLYVLVEAVDLQPAHLLTLRGITLADIAPAPRNTRRGSGADTAGGPSGAVSSSADSPDADGSDADAGPDSTAPAPAVAPAKTGTGDFDPVIADPTLLHEALGEDVAALIVDFYRSGRVEPASSEKADPET